MAAYYNEWDKKTAAWLRELIKAGLIADGEVDERSITDVEPADVAGFTQCHWFAGIGGWSYALRLAGWPDSRSVWTGSCPCQPFSSAGAQAGGADARDLWPAWFRLIRECLPRVVFGEQVKSAIGHGWLDRLCDDLEREDYAVGPVCLPAASVGAFHIRQRLWFVADAEVIRPAVWRPGALQGAKEFAWTSQQLTGCRSTGRMAVTDERGCEVAHVSVRPEGQEQAAPIKRVVSYWSVADWVPCADGRLRPVEPGTFPLAYGLPARVGRLRGYGNAIVAPLAAEVIRAYMDIAG